MKKWDNKFSWRTKIGLGLASACSLCGSIYGSYRLFNKSGNLIRNINLLVEENAESLRVWEDAVATSLDVLSEIKGDLTSFRQKHEELKNSNNLLLGKIAELEEEIDGLKTKFSKNN